MNKSITNLVVAVVATLAFNTVANAQQDFGQTTQQTQTQTQTQQYVVPTVQPPQQQNNYYFGMSVELRRGYTGTTLRIVNVTWGSPAQRAGLEVGDEIRTVNGRGFQFANNSFDAVAMMNRFVNANSAPAPAAAASVQGAQAHYILPPVLQPTAQMVVRNVRNGQNVFVTVTPERRGWGGPAPAATASVAMSRR
jgi:membrane-associated protease RseP (regulator of RpoE activity)